MYKALVIDSDELHAERIRGALRQRNLEVIVFPSPQRAMLFLRRCAIDCRVLVLNVSHRNEPWLRVIHELQEIGLERNAASATLILCISKNLQDPHFEVAIERAGARIAYER